MHQCEGQISYISVYCRSFSIRQKLCDHDWFFFFLEIFLWRSASIVITCQHDYDLVFTTGLVSTVTFSLLPLMSYDGLFHRQTDLIRTDIQSILNFKLLITNCTVKNKIKFAQFSVIHVCIALCYGYQFSSTIIPV